MPSAKTEPKPIVTTVNGDVAGVTLGPIPDWVARWEPDVECAATDGTHTSCLLLSRQVHAERHASFFHSAIRLETMQAVHSHSQWQIQFEPKTQAVVLHMIRIRRGDQIIEQADLSRLRIMQREEGLEGYVISGWATGLLVLEDVRPKDIIEAAFTVTGQPRILPENFNAFFVLPETESVARFRFVVTASSHRPVLWRSSAPSLEPVATQRDGFSYWTWEGAGHVGLKPEPNVPAWHFGSPWIQFSDGGDWGQVARAIWQAWNDSSGINEELPAPAALLGPDADPDERLEAILRFVQDELRYLSVNLELGGQIPTNPATVLRRRFGDCKDLSFLLVHLLRTAGFKARPILVHTQLRQAVAKLLPSPTMFNHALVEIESGGAKHWIDATVSMQGGGPRNRGVGQFSFGLPLGEETVGLVAAPSVPAARIEIIETLLLDTTGADSLLAVVHRRQGLDADGLRHGLANQGKESIERARASHYARRFGRATREGAPTYADDRQTGVLTIAEVYKVNGFLSHHHASGRCVFSIPVPWALSAMPTLTDAEIEGRRSPLEIPHPLTITHALEIEAASLPALPSPREDVCNDYFRYGQRIRGLRRSWTITSTFTTLADSVPASKVKDYLKQLEAVWGCSAWQLLMPLGIAHAVRRRDFGRIPEPLTDSPGTGGLPTPANPPGSRQPSPIATAEPPSPPATGPTPEGAENRRAKRRRKPMSVSAKVFIVFCLLFAGFVMCAWLLLGTH